MGGRRAAGECRQENKGREKNKFHTVVPIIRVCHAPGRSRDEHGVSRYPFGSEGTLDLSCEARASESEKPRLRIKSNVPLVLDVVWGGGREKREITPG